jgi:hypothetical protein
MASIFGVEDYTKQETSMNHEASNMEKTCSSETSVGFQGNALRCIPEDRTLHNHPQCSNVMDTARDHRRPDRVSFIRLPRCDVRT